MQRSKEKQSFVFSFVKTFAYIIGYPIRLAYHVMILPPKKQKSILKQTHISSACIYTHNI